MSNGSGGTNTVQTQSGPPQQYLDAFTNVLGQANQVAATPNQSYPGQTVAGFSPDQSAGITATENAYGMSAPYINTAAQYINNSTTPLAPGVQPYVDAATGLYGSASSLAGDASSIYGGLTQGLSPEEIERYQSPYTKSVIDATQAQFNNQNAIQQNQLTGQAGTSGAYGGDRQGVAQAVLAGQQQTAQAPVIADLQNQGYMTGLNTAQQQQQMRAGAAQGLIGAGQGLGSAGAGILGASGQLLGANEANAWLNSQAGYGMANLGNQAQSSALTGANALLGVGGLEQQQGQALLNAPYQQYLAQQAYPFQTTGWLANIAEGLGGSSGGTGSTTSPGPSVGSQIAGAGLAGAGVLGQTGAFGNNGWLTGAGGLFGSAAAGSGAANIAASGAPLFASGGMIPHRAPGGALVSDQPPFGNGMPVSSNSPYGFSLPDATVSIVPGSDAGQMGNISGHAGHNLMKTSTGSTSTTTGGPESDSTFGTLLKTAGAIAAGVYGGPAGALAANALGSQVHFSRGGGMRPVNDNWSGGWSEPKRAAGGATQVTIVPGSYAGSPGVPQIAMAPILQAPFGRDMPPAEAGAQGNAGWSSNPSVQSYLSNTLGGASFAPPPVYTPPPPAAAPAAPAGPDPNAAAIAQAAEDLFHNNQEHGGDGGGNKLGGRIARRADGGGNDEPDDADPSWDMPVAPTGMGPPAPPPAAGMRPATAAPVHADNGGPWKTLTDVGLGIMGGSSPNALTNVGRGALQGLKQASTDKQADALVQYRQMSEENAARRLADAADATLAKLKQGDTKLGIDQQKADTSAHAVDVRQDIADRAAAYKAKGQTDAQAIASAKLDIARDRLGVQQQRADTADRGVDVQQQRADTADQAVVLRQKALQSSQEYKQQQLALRQTGMDQQASSNVMNNASRMVSMDLTGKLTLADAVKQQLANRPGASVAPQQAAPTAAAPQIAPMPKSAAEAVPGTIYNTARGPAKWDGTQFIPVTP